MALSKAREILRAKIDPSNQQTQEELTAQLDTTVRNATSKYESHSTFFKVL